VNVGKATIARWIEVLAGAESSRNRLLYSRLYGAGAVDFKIARQAVDGMGKAIAHGSWLRQGLRTYFGDDFVLGDNVFIKIVGN